MSKLDQLRARIRELDAEILRLVAERTQTARTIGEEKKAAGIPLRDFEVERRVLDLAAQRATTLGLPPDSVRALMQQLIATSRDEQERLSYSDYAGAAEDILIVGGCGKMGRWFVDFFGNQGHRVSVYDINSDSKGAQAPRRPGDKAHSENRRSSRTCERTGVCAATPNLRASLAGTSFALISVPLEVIPEIIDELVDLHYAGVVFDIASLKSHLKPSIERARAAGVAITSIHPMFGAGARSLSDQVVCLCDCGDADATSKVGAFFSETAATLVRLSLDEHDRIISRVLGLSHLINLVFARVLMGGGLSFDELNRVGSTTFHSQMTTTATVIQENPELYYAIQKFNPFSAELRHSLARELETISKWIGDNNKTAFVEMMQAGRRWMTGDDAG